MLLEGEGIGLDFANLVQVRRKVGNVANLQDKRAWTPASAGGHILRRAMCARWSWLVFNPSLEEHVLDIQKTSGVSADDLGISVVCPG